MALPIITADIAQYDGQCVSPYIGCPASGSCCLFVCVFACLFACLFFRLFLLFLVLFRWEFAVHFSCYSAGFPPKKKSTNPICCRICVVSSPNASPTRPLDSPTPADSPSALSCQVLDCMEGGSQQTTQGC